jgi:hypothetical protein
MSRPLHLQEAGAVRVLKVHAVGRLRALDRKPARADSRGEVAEGRSRLDCR